MRVVERFLVPTPDRLATPSAEACAGAVIGAESSLGGPEGFDEEHRRRRGLWGTGRGDDILELCDVGELEM